MTALVILCPSIADANFEPVETFEEPDAQVFNVRAGIAVNPSGAGGVPVGSLYTSGRGGAEGISRFSASGEFEGHFGAGRSLGVAVFQGNGNVYTLTAATESANEVITVTNADGSKNVTGFGVKGVFGESVKEGPEKLHGVTANAAGIAVDSAGNVYIADEAGVVKESRIMVFKPKSPGDFAEYEYAGQKSDVAIGFLPNHPTFDAAGNLYVVGVDNSILEFAPGQPNSPICTYKVSTGGIVGMTVNPDTGEVFYFSAKDKKIHQLAACKEGKFEEIPGSAFVPDASSTENIEVLALNPAIAWSKTRPAGVLYGLPRNPAPSNEPNYIFAPAEVHLAEVVSASVSAVTSSTALLEAQINPKGASTSYTFQYTTEADFEVNEFKEATEAPLGGALLGGGQEALAASAGISGLSPDTEYRYRVVATTSEGPTVGAAESFHTFPLQGPGLPDSRAYELVSPAEKHGGQVFPLNPVISSCEVECKPGSLASERFPRQSSPKGDLLVYEGFPFSATEGAPLIDEYRSQRTGSGWVTTNPTPALFQANFEAGYKAFDVDLTTGLFYQNRPPTLAPSAPENYANLYAQPSGEPAVLSPLLTSPAPNRPASGSEALNTVFAGSSADLSRIFFAANDALTSVTPFAPAAVDGGAKKDNLYESSSGQLSLVNVLPGNEGTEPGAVFGSGSLLSKETGEAFEAVPDFSNAVSEDGSRVFWSAPSGQVYVRENGQTTLKVPDAGKFLTAATDGSAVLLGNGHLYNLETEALTDLTGGKGGFKGITGQSDDLSSIYFVMGPTSALGNLTEGSATVTNVHSVTGTFSVGQAIEGAGVPAGTTIVSVGSGTLELSASATASKENVSLSAQALLTGEELNSEGSKARASGFNLYSWQDGSLAFVATLASQDKEDWTTAPVKRTAEASPGGRWASFLSREGLTGYDNSGPSCVKNSNLEFISGPCLEVFLYDSLTGELSCPSCNPANATSLGWSHLPTIQNSPSSLPQPRYLTDQGRLFFDTRDSLSPFDTNGGIEDIYEYEPDDVGSCVREGGCVSLISAGTGLVDSNFLAVDETGANVFFTTRDRLVPADRDNLIDVYDARVEGGFPPEEAPVKCAGEACQPPPPLQSAPQPTSSGVQEGNVKPSKACPKGKVRNQKGNCVKKKAKKAKHHKKAHHKRAAANKRGGAK